MVLAFLSFLKTALDSSIYFKTTLGCLNNLEVIKICICIFYVYINIQIDREIYFAAILVASSVASMAY